MEYSIHQNGKHATISLSGSFTDSDHERFSEILDFFHQPSLRHVTFEIHELTFLDSAALGMFLIAREAALSHGDLFFDIIGATGQPKRAFTVAKFDMIMNLA